MLLLSQLPQRYILPIFVKIYLLKVVVSSRHTCLTLATLFLPSIGPPPVNLLRSGPELVTVNADNSWKSTHVMRVDHYCRMMTLDENQQMKQIVASTSDASTRLVIRLLPKSSPQTTAVSHRCKMKYVYCIKMNVNVRVLLLSGLACLLAGPCWWAGGLCREVFPKRALEALEKRALKRNSVSEGCQEGSQAPDALAFISADGMGFLDDSFLNSKRVTDT